MAKKAAGKSKPAKSKGKAKPNAKARSRTSKVAKKLVAKAKPAAKKLAERSAAKVKSAAKSKAKAAGKKLARTVTKVAKAAAKPGAARKAGEQVRRKVIEVSQAVTDRTNSIADSITTGVAMATGVVVGTVEAILPPRESVEFSPQPPPLPGHAAEDFRDEEDELDDETDDDDLAEIE